MNQNVNLNRTILRCLNYSDEYARKVLPFIKPEYFPENAEKIVFNEISEFINDYGNVPTYEALVIQLNKKSISEDDYLKSIEILNESYSNKDDKIDIDFLIKNTEEFCQERAIYNAVLESISILDDKHKTLSKGAIPTLLAEALGVSFDNSVGHDYLDDSESRYDYYHRLESRIPFDIAYFNKITNGGLPNKTLNIFVAGTNVGKEIRNDAKIYTPDGERIFGDLKVGEYVYGSDGKPTKIIGVYPQGVKPVYKITFSDGRTVDSGLEHLWNVFNGNSRKFDTLTLAEIIERRRTSSDFKLKTFIPLCKPVELNYSNTVKLDPYLMGLLIGDGCLRGSVSFSSADQFIVDKISNIVKCNNCTVKKIGNTKYDYSITDDSKFRKNVIKDILVEYDLFNKYSYEKTIPEDYLYSSIENRICILQGLMDSDGYCDSRGNVSFTSTSKILANQVVFLVHSLGGIAKFKNRQKSYTHNNVKKLGRHSYDIGITISRDVCIFSLPRKVDRFNMNTKNDTLKLRIDNIEYIGDYACQCIQVDAVDSLYLVEEFVVTHNTTLKCHFASNYLTIGKNVLYITMEMAEEEIAKRIDSNLLDIPMDELATIGIERYNTKVDRVRKKTVGKLVIKQFPTAAAGVTHFRALLNELRLKKNFVPDVILVDYMNICCSSRIKMGGSVNSYTYIKSIAEELRGLAVEYDVPIITSSQLNRSANSNSDPNVEDISESHGTSMTADFIAAIITTDELESLGQLMIKQIKSRYSDKSQNKRFVVGIDRGKSRLYDIEQSGQEGIIDKGKSEDQMEELYAKTFSKKKSAFEGFTV